jgi:hypothetical protein
MGIGAVDVGGEGVVGVAVCTMKRLLVVGLPFSVNGKLIAIPWMMGMLLLCVHSCARVTYLHGCTLFIIRNARTSHSVLVSSLRSSRSARPGTTWTERHVI